MIASIVQLIAQLEAIGQAKTGRPTDFDDCARRLVEETRNHWNEVAIVIWNIEEDGVPAMRMENGLHQFASDGRFRVSPSHHDQLRTCSQQETVVLERIGEVAPGVILIARMFPLPNNSMRCVLEIIGREELFGASHKSIDLVGKKLCDLLSQRTTSLIQREAGAETKRELANAQQEISSEIGARQLDQFLRLLYEQVSTNRVANVAATDGRVLTGCDRLSVILFRGSGCRILAISHVETVQRRAGLSQAMRKMANLAKRLSQPLVLQGDYSQCPENMSEAFADFIAESRSQSLALIPLSVVDEFEKTKHELAHRKPPKKKTIGLLLAEQFVATQDFRVTLEKVDWIKPHVAQALNNAREYESVLFLPLWKWIGAKVHWLLGYPKWATLSVAGAIAVACLAMALVPATYRVHAEGRAMPEIQHEIYAKTDGIIKEVLVMGGQRVKKGETLLTLDNKELDLDLIATKNKIIELSSQIHALAVRLDASRLRGDHEGELTTEGERASATVELEGAQRRLELLEERSQRLRIVSDFDGVVATFQPEEFLSGRPVKQGDLVLEVMEDDGPWRLELDVAEYRMGHVLSSFKKHGPLQVRYIAMTEVSQPKYAELTDIATRADHNEKLGAYVRVYAKIRREEVPNQRIGAEVSAKVRCPGYSLFYSLCGDVVEFIQRNVWW